MPNSRRIASVVFVLTLLSPGMAATADQEPAADRSAAERMAARLEQVRDALIEVRHDLHRHPEVSGEEKRTAGVVAERLRALGLEVRTGVGGHGVVATLRGALPGKTVGYRADMDAMPYSAPDPVPYASLTPGVRHVCGHDVHTTVALGVAEALVAVRDVLPGTVKLFFQPAEEQATGARAMLDDGALDAPIPDAFFAVHTAPFPVGRIGAVEGPTLYARDRAVVRATGEGDVAASAAALHKALEGAATVQAPASMAELAALQLSPGDSVAQVVRRSDRELAMLISPADPTGRSRIREAIEEAVAAAGGGGIAWQLEYQSKWVAGVDSDPELVRSTYPALRAALGQDGLVVTQAAGPAFSEDFGFFLEEIPGAMYWLGVSNPQAGTVGMPHSPDYVADDGSIHVGAKAMSRVLFDYLVSEAEPRPSR